MKRTLPAVGLGALCIILGASPACAVMSALCIKNTLNGSLKMRATGTCRATEIQLGSFDGTTLQLSGINLQIVSGSGATNGSVNGTGNLIVGYNANDGSRSHGGSHNIVVGDQHSYPNFGGLVAGFANTISGSYVSVTGGACNVAGSGPAPQQGCTPPANAGPTFAASVSGGGNNVASGNAASVSGGVANSATGAGASVSGGALNVAATDPTFIPSAASVSGGACNVAGAGTPLSQCSSLDTFDFPAPSVSGGTQNVASGHRASISGGQGNDASGTNSSVSGGVLIHGSNNNEWHAGQSAGFPTGMEY